MLRQAQARGWWLLLMANVFLATSLPAAAADICSFVPQPTVFSATWSDAEGWGKPEYYATIQLADLDGDGRAELVGRGPAGIIVQHFGPASRSWFPGRVSLPLSDEAGWNRPERYSTIRLADVDGDGRAELLAQADDGPHAWKYDLRSDAWREAEPALALRAASLPARTPELVADLDGDGRAELVTRSSNGIETWRSASGGGEAEKLTAQVQGFPPFTGNQLTAYNYISSQLLDNAPNADIRAQYSNQALAQNFAAAYPAKVRSLTAPAGVPASDWAAVVGQLLTEFGYVADVNNWFALHEKFIGELNQSNILSVSIVSGKIQLPSNGSKDNDSVGFNILSLIARVVQGISSLAGQPEVSSIAGLFSTAFSAAASFSGENENQPSILSTVIGLQEKLNTHFQNAVLANGCLADYYLKDLKLLESLGLPIAQGRYNWDATLDGKLLAAGRPAYELTLWQTLTPVVWENGSLDTPCYGQGSCAIPGVMSSYPGGYYFLQQESDSLGAFYFLKIKGVRVDDGEPFQPPLAALNAIFQAPPNGFGFPVQDVLTGQDPYSDPNGWSFSGPTPDLVFNRVAGPAPPANAPLAIAEVHTSAGRSSTNPVARIRVRLGPGADPTTFRAFLNGREITGKFVRPTNSACHFATCNWSATVTLIDGLVAGRNELRVEAHGQGAVRHKDSLVFSIGAPTGIAPATVVEQLDHLIANYVQERNVPGLAVGIWIPGEGQYLAARGVANRDTGLSRDTVQPFRIASITKTFTATVILQLIDEGKLARTDKLSKWFPDFPRADEITVDHLLLMRSGIADSRAGPGP